MSSTGATLFWLFLGLGLGSLLLGISIRAGKYKTWWLIKSTPIVPVAAAYIGIPFSIPLFVLALSAFLPDLHARRRALDIMGVSLVAVSILAIWRPRWLAPKWLLWLEDNHADIIYPLLQKEARKMGGQAWESRVRTQAGLEQWVAEVRRQHGK
jgi:hypothetical protein